MNKNKYVGLDVDQATTVVAIEDARGDFLMESFLPTRTVELREFFKGLEGRIHVAFEEGTQATWLYDLIEPLVKEVVVCDPRRNKLIQSGNKGDRVDARKLARLLRLGELHAVYHGEHGNGAFLIAVSDAPLKTTFIVRLKFLFSPRVCSGLFSIMSE